jgi:hypothetical protein
MALVSAPVQISAAELSGSGPASVAQILAQTNLANQQANVQIPAQAQLTQAQTGLVGEQTGIANLDRQLKGIQLASTTAMIRGSTEAYQEMIREQAAAKGQAPIIGPQPDAAAAPTAPGAEGVGAAPSAPGAVGQAPVTQLPLDASVDDIHKHIHDQLSISPYTVDGLPNMMSDVYIKKAADRMAALGGNAMDILKWSQDALKARYDLTKTAAETIASVAQGKKSEAEAAAELQKVQGNTANQVQNLIDAGDFTGAILKAKTLLSPNGTPIDIAPGSGQIQGLSQIKALARSSSDALATQEQARKFADTTSEIANRLVQQNISRGQLAVSQGNLQRENLAEGTKLSQTAGSSSRTVNYGNQLLNDLTALEVLVKPQVDPITGKISPSSLRQEGSSLVLGAQAWANASPGVKSTIGNYLVGTNEHGDVTLDAQNLMRRIGSGITEVKAQAMATGGTRGAAGSDNRLKLLEESAAGTGFDLTKPTQVMRDSIDYVRTLTQSEMALATAANKSANAGLNVLGRDMRGNQVFQPIIPTPAVPLPPPTPAPVAALENLKKYPETRDQFRQKYGYLPSGR